MLALLVAALLGGVSQEAPIEGPLSAKLANLEADDIRSLSIEMTEYDDTVDPPESKQVRIDLTADAARLLPLLNESKLVNSGYLGVGMPPTGVLHLRAAGGKRLRLQVYPFVFFLYARAPGHRLSVTYVYKSDIAHFVEALKYDKANRVFSEREYRDLLLKYASAEAMHEKAFTELARDFKDRRAIGLVPRYLEKWPGIMYSLSRLKDVDDSKAVDAVWKQLYSADINTARQSASVLKAWGHLDRLQEYAHTKQEQASKNFTTHVAYWFAEQGRFQDAVKTIRTQGLEQFQLGRAYGLLRPLMPRDEASDDLFFPHPHEPAPSDEDRRAILLLMADIVETRTSDLSWITLDDLWHAMDVQYNVEKKRLVPRDRDALGLLFRDAETGKEAAAAMRQWCDEKFPATEKPR